MDFQFLLISRLDECELMKYAPGGLDALLLPKSNLRQFRVSFYAIMLS